MKVTNPNLLTHAFNPMRCRQEALLTSNNYETVLLLVGKNVHILPFLQTWLGISLFPAKHVGDMTQIYIMYDRVRTYGTMRCYCLDGEDCLGFHSACHMKAESDCKSINLHTRKKIIKKEKEKKTSMTILQHLVCSLEVLHLGGKRSEVESTRFNQTMEQWPTIYSWVELLLTSIDCGVGSTAAVISSRWYLRPCCAAEHDPTLMMNEAPSRTVASRTAVLLSHSTSEHRTSEGQVTRESPERSALHQSRPGRLFLGTGPGRPHTALGRRGKKTVPTRIQLYWEEGKSPSSRCTSNYYCWVFFSEMGTFPLLSTMRFSSPPLKNKHLLLWIHIKLPEKGDFMVQWRNVNFHPRCSFKPSQTTISPVISLWGPLRLFHWVILSLLLLDFSFLFFFWKLEQSMQC